MVKIRFSSFSSQDSGINPFEELLLASVDELDFAEDELFVDEDETLLLRISLDEDSFSGSTKLLSSSPQATNKKANASVKKRRIGLDVIPRAMRGGSILLYTSS